MRHFHILWESGLGSSFDYEGHDTEVAAQTSAERLVRVGERFSIIEVSGFCDKNCMVWKARVGYRRAQEAG